jgi:hypothetical protein
MDKEQFAFTFDELSKRQLLKLASAYTIKHQGAMPNDKMDIEELRELIKKNLKIEEDGTIIKTSEKNENDKEVKLSGGARVRMIII